MKRGSSQSSAAPTSRVVKHSELPHRAPGSHILDVSDMLNHRIAYLVGMWLGHLNLPFAVAPPSMISIEDIVQLYEYLLSTSQTLQNRGIHDREFLGFSTDLFAELETSFLEAQGKCDGLTKDDAVGLLSCLFEDFYSATQKSQCMFCGTTKDHAFINPFVYCRYRSTRMD